MKRNKSVQFKLQGAPRPAQAQLASVRLARATRVRVISRIVHDEPSREAVEQALRLAQRAQSAKTASFLSQYSIAA